MTKRAALLFTFATTTLLTLCGCDKPKSEEKIVGSVTVTPTGVTAPGVSVGPTGVTAPGVSVAVAATGAKLVAEGNQTCASGTVCDLSCPTGSCFQTCTAGSTCNTTCAGGSCRQFCVTGAVCNFTCNGGKCKQGCEGPTCQKTCTGNDCT